MSNATETTTKQLMKALRISIIELHRLKGITNRQFITPDAMIIKEMQIWLTAIAFITRKVDAFFQGSTDRDFEVSHMEIQFIQKEDFKHEK